MARTSKHINRRQADTFFDAVQFAARIGRPLNTSVDIDLLHTASLREEASANFERLRDNHFTRWLRYQSQRLGRPFGPPYYVWTIENGSCANVHWLVHIPPELHGPFRIKLLHWMDKVVGPVACTSAVLTKNAETPMGKARYMMKGLNPRCAPAYRVRPSPQGVVHGKRCGVSESLGPAAIARHDGAARVAAA